MLNLLYARAGQDIRGELLERMGRSSARRRLLIVPEQYSHETERAMCTALENGATLESEVLSFTRLAGRLTDAAGGGAVPMLDAGGRMLLMYAALRRVSDALTAYRAPSRKPAFLTGLLATVDECRSYRVEPQALIRAGEELGGHQGDKLRDLGLICSAYQAMEEAGAADPRGRLDRLARQLRDTGWGAGMAFFVYGFTDFTPQEEAVLLELARQGELTVAFVCDPGDDPAGIFQPALRAARRLARYARKDAVPVREETLVRPLDRHPSLAFLEQHLFGASGPVWSGQCAVTRVNAVTPRQEVEWCAAEVLRLLREEGCRCRDIAVCVRRLDGYSELIHSVFARYGVPVFLSAMEDVLEKPVLALVTSALSAAAEDYPYEELFRYLKTGLTGISDEERDLLENYVLTWDLKGSAWTRKKPWDMHPEGYGHEFSEEDSARVLWLDQLRRRVIVPLETLRKGKDKTGKGRALALYQFLEDIGLPARLAQRADSLDRRGERTAAAQYRQLWEILVGGLEQSALLLEDAELELDEFSRLFSLVLSQYDVGAIPVSLDAVTVADAPRLAHREVKVLFLLGADSNSIPDCAPSPGLFSDRDRAALAALEVELAPRQEDKLRREMTIVYETCARPSDRLYVSHAAVGTDGSQRAPSFLWERLAALFPDGPVADGADPSARLAAPDAALELVGRDPGAADLLRKISGLATRVQRIQSAADWRRGRLSRLAVDKLFGPVVSMSATKLDLINSCHFSYFLRFGLDARPRQRAAFRAADYGTFVHDVLENTLRSARDQGISLDNMDEVRRLSREAADRYERETLTGLEDESARFRYLFQRMKQAVLLVVESVAAELSVSDFIPAAFELGFGRTKGPLPPVEVEQGVRLQLTGFVDRVDEWVHDGKRYLRVVDYKTGKKSFDFSDVEDGRGLQMLLYLFALTREGERVFGPGEIVPAGVLYVPARTALVNGERGMSDEDIQKARDKLLRRQGLVLDEPEVLAAMEHITARGCRFLPISKGRFSGEYLVSSEQMDALDTYITAVLRRAAGELAAGSIDADPYWHGADKNPCRWCDYRPACHFEEGSGDARRFRRGISAAEFWQWMRDREEEKHGH